MVGVDQPLFSVIIPTRNRSSVCAVALQSVLEQRFRDFEIILVNDGSSAEHEPRYRELADAAPRTRMLTMARSALGHGPSCGRNSGAGETSSAYLCFLDDDDQWTDPEHLGRVADVVAACTEPPDIILANQHAFRDGALVPGAVWVEDLRDRLRGPSDSAGAYTVTPAELLASPAHCHLNTTIVSRSFYLDIGGFDAGLRYEEDRDFYLRAIDRARTIKYLPHIVSRHNVPDPAAKSSMSTADSELSRRLYQLRVFDKAALLSERSELRRYAMRQRGYILKHIAGEAARIGRLDCAAYYAREALTAKLTVGWLGATASFAVRRFGPRTQGSV
jgi:glycosyltransferase involved in cell wall biosynthesis